MENQFDAPILTAEEKLNEQWRLNATAMLRSNLKKVKMQRALDRAQKQAPHQDAWGVNAEREAAEALLSFSEKIREEEQKNALKKKEKQLKFRFSRKQSRPVPVWEMFKVEATLPYKKITSRAPLTFSQRALEHEIQEKPWMMIAGIRMPPINGKFVFYHQKEGETRKQWRSRLFKMRKNLNYGNKIKREQDRLDLPLYEQIKRISQFLGANINAFSKLSEVTLRVGEKVVQETSSYQKVRRQAVDKVAKRPNLIENKNLALKFKRYWLQQEWREARILRHEKMSRMLLRSGNHLVKSLRSQLEIILEKCAQHENQVGAMPLGEMSPGLVENAKDHLFDDFWPESVGLIPWKDGWLIRDRIDDLEPDFYDLSTWKVKSPDPDWFDIIQPYLYETPYISLESSSGRFMGVIHPNLIPEGEMEVEGAKAQGKPEAKVDKKSNVEIQQQEGTSVASSLPPTKAVSPFEKFSAAKSDITDKRLHDRWFTIRSFKWQNSNAVGSIVLDMNLPKDILENPNFKNSPNYAMFSRHIYWKGDIAIKIIANCNVRQFGQLQFSFYYGDQHDTNYVNLRTNIYTASQRLHALLTANFSNEVIIKIPFEYIFPILTVNRISTKGSKSLGNLLGLVVVPLTAAANCPNWCSVKVLVSFQQNCFSGMVGTSIASSVRMQSTSIAEEENESESDYSIVSEGEMMPALATIIAAKSLLDKNRDRPTVTSPGMAVIPVNSSSWCIGNGQPDYSNILRLNPSNVLPYPEGRIPNKDEMTIASVKDIYGMFRILDWKASDIAGSQISSFDATPLTDMAFYPTIQNDGVNCSILPPVSVLSSLFAYWRGSLDLRIDIVGATELSGSLMICYVPGVLKDYKLTMNDCFSCPHSIYSIHENRQITFKIPYLASRMFWPRNRTLSKEYPSFNAPGAIFIFVYNQLIVNCTIPDHCKLVCYLKGGDDFELSVPASPSLGLSFNPHIFHPATTAKRIVPVEGYTPMYVGSWRSAYFRADPTVAESVKQLCNDTFKIDFNLTSGTQIYNIPVVRYGAVSDHITQFQLINLTFPQWTGLIGKVGLEERTTPFEMSIPLMADSGTTIVTLKHNSPYMLFWSMDGFIYGSPMDSSAVSFWKLLVIQFLKERTKYSYINQLGLYLLAIIWKEVTDKKAKRAGGTTIVSTDWWKPANMYWTEETIPRINAEGDEKEQTLAKIATPQETAQSSASKLVFGEQFLDLKDLCRRYQLYASNSLQIVKLLNTANWRTIVLRFPVCPQGLNLDLGNSQNPKEYWNRTRDGPIPIIASAYRFFTGGIRFRICINVQYRDTDRTRARINELRGKIFVQHRPNVISTSEQVIVQSGTTLGTDDIELPGYAAYHQFEDLNNVLSVEVPFYIPSIRTYLQRPSTTEYARQFSNLGELVVGLTVFDYEALNFSYDIYYALADDARFSVFVGFPAVLDITTIADENPRASVEEESRVFESEDDDHCKILITTRRSIDVVLDTLVSSNIMPEDEHIYFKTRLERALNNEDLGDMESMLKSLKQRLPVGEMMGWLYGSKTNDVIDKADNLLSNIDDNTIENIKETSNNLKSITQSVKDTFLNLMPTVDGVKDKCVKYVDLIINLVTNLCHVILNFNLKSIGVAIVSIFTQLKIVCWSAATKFSDSLTKLFEVLTTVSSTKPKIEDIVPSGEMASPSDEDLATTGYISTLIAGVAATLGMTAQFGKNRIKDIGSLILEGLNKFTFTANQLFTFIKNNLIACKRIGEWLMSDHPSISKLAFLKGDNESVYEWAVKVQEFTDPRKENAIFTNPRKATEAFSLAAQASLLQIKMLDLQITTGQSSILNLLIKKIHDLRDRLTKTHIAPPVRFEPFVFELTGNTGVGKSELLKILPYELFKHLGLKHEGELIYHRAIGNAYWNNLRNQPVCTVDEKFPINSPEFLGVQLAELFQLKSSCIFNPPMADIPDKNLRYNPILVQYASNAPFPELACVIDRNAVYRRRDCLIMVSLRDDLLQKYGTEGKYSMLNKQEKGKVDQFDYLRFYFHRDPCEENVAPDAWGPALNFNDFKIQLSKRFKDFFIEEEQKYRREITRMISILPEEGDKTIDNIFNYDWLGQMNGSAPAEVRQIQEFQKKQHILYDQFRNLMHLPTEMKKLKERIAINVQEYLGAPAVDIKQMVDKYSNDYDNKNGEGTARGEGLEPEEFVFKCPHLILKNILQCSHGCVTYHEDINGFKIERSNLDNAELFNICKQSATDAEVFSHYNQFIANKDMKISPKEIEIYYKSCEYKDCPLKTKDERRSFIADNFANQGEIKMRLAVGRSINGFVPKEFLEGLISKEEAIKEHDKINAELPKVKSWLQTLKDYFLQADWRKWLRRLSIAIAIFAFLGTVLGIWRYSQTETLEEAFTEQNLITTAGSVGLIGTTAACLVDKRIDAHTVAERAIQAISQGHTSGDYKVSHTNKRVNAPAFKSVQGLVARGEGLGVQNEIAVKSRLNRNSFFLSLLSDKSYMAGRCLGICGNYALIVSHFWEGWNSMAKKVGSTKMLYIPCIDSRVSAIPIDLNNIKYYLIENSALGLIELPKQIKPFKDIRPLIASKKDHKNINMMGVISELTLDNNNTYFDNYHVKLSEYKNVFCQGNDMWKDFTSYDGYNYEGFSGVGRCGSVLMGLGIQAPIIGMHVAGFKGMSHGMSDCIYREMFDSLGNQPSPVSPEGEGVQSSWYVDSHVIGIGKVRSLLAHREKGKSRIVPSEVQLKGEFPVFTQPAVLSNRDPRIKENSFSPMLEGCKYHGSILKQFNQKDLDLAIKDYENLILAKCKPQRKPSLLTIDEAIAGFEGKLGYEHLEFSTSEGFPFSGVRPKWASNKRWLFNFNDDNKYVSCKKELTDRLNRDWQLRLNKQIPDTIFTDCLKDCTIPHEKVLKPGKTRIFSISPVQYSIQQRQCTLDFSVAFMACRRDLEHMVGCNPDSFEWTQLAQDLLEVGDAIMDGDYSKFGDSIPAQIIHAAFKIIAKWYIFNGYYNQEHQAQLEIMPYEIANCIHLMFDHLYETVCGQPSGNSLTVIINSIANSIYLRLAWLSIMRDTQYCSLKDFAMLVKLFSYGDDIIVALHKLIREIFNAESIASFFLEYDLKFTSADKSDNIIKYKTIWEADFLKRRFLLHPFKKNPQILLAPLQKESIEDTINWVWDESFDRANPDSPTFREMSKQVCQDSIRNAFGHGPEYYNEWSDKINSFWLKLGENLKYDSWESMDFKIFTLGLDLSPYHKW